MAYTRQQYEQAFTALATGLAQRIIDVSKILKHAWIEHEATEVANNGDVYFCHPVLDHASNYAASDVATPFAANREPYLPAILTSEAYRAEVRNLMASAVAVKLDAALLAQYANFSMCPPVGTAGVALTERIVSKTARMLDNYAAARYHKKCLAIYSNYEMAAAELQDKAFDAVEQLTAWDASKAGMDATARNYVKGEMTYRGMTIIGTDQIAKTGAAPVCIHNLAFLDKCSLLYKTARRALVNDATNFQVYSETANGVGSDLGVALRVATDTGFYGVEVRGTAAITNTGVQVNS